MADGHTPNDEPHSRGATADGSNGYHTGAASAADPGNYRRSFMKLAGGGTAVTASGTVGAATAFDGVETERVVDLGEEGLSEGDVIDPYLDEYFVDGTEVHVPPGEYDWEGRGFHSGATRNAAVIGLGRVILHPVEGQYRNTVVAEEGTVTIKNVTVRGIVEGSRNRFEAREGARIVVDNWNFPDGSEPGSRSCAFSTQQEHAGEVEFRNCYVHDFSDNGFDVASQGNAEGGRVVIDNCVSHNNNIAGFRVGGNESVIRNSLVLNDDAAPVDGDDARNMRGIRLDDGDESQDLLIENTDVVHTYRGPGAGGPIQWSSAAASGSGHVENVRIHNDTATAAIADRHSRAENWTGNDISVVGDGNLDVPDWFTNVFQGSECTGPETVPSTNPHDGGEVDVGDDEGTNDDGSDEEADDGIDDEGIDEDVDERPTGADGDLPNRVIVDGALTDAVTSYELQFSGDVEPDDAISSEGTASWDEMDDVVDDGAVVGVVRYGIDGFRYSGELTNVSVDGVVDVTVGSNEL